jgi:aminoglycoside phosphotransferase (APT) family kinase protein
MVQYGTCCQGRPTDMDLDELHDRLVAFARAHTGDPSAEVRDVRAMPGHAGFSYGCTFIHTGGENALVLRLPPPGVRPVGNADILRQGRVVAALAGTDVPVAPVRWMGDDERWFGRPYLFVDLLPGRTLLLTAGEERPDLDAPLLEGMAANATRVLAALHRLDWQQTVPSLGPPVTLEAAVARGDYLFERTADPDLVRAAPMLKSRLLARLPSSPSIGIVHGDFQWSNLLFRPDGSIVAVIDWELAEVGATLIDLGWLMVFTDRESWEGIARWDQPTPSPERLATLYEDAAGRSLPDVSWYRAYAGYRFGLIAGFNLMLHRRAKRIDPLYEDLAPSIPRLLERGLEVLG